ncbi:hypothetical protein BY458DRAFT_517384 [Sporodiniella umbellata]|nr:hypothetical protein BY458DRAFT_517384 [Sporodiniella umbellata]
MPDVKYTLSTNLGIFLGFLGMTGLALTIVSLLPLNVYNIYYSINTLTELVRFEHNRTAEWNPLHFSADAMLYSIFLLGAVFSATLTIVFTFNAYFFRKRSGYNEEQHISAEPNGYKQYQTQYSNNNSTWFVRISYLTIIVQLSFALFGAHLKYIVKSDSSVIPLQIQSATFVCLTIMWMNYLSLTLFLFILLFASCFILMGAKKKESQSNPERQPLV